VAEQRIEVEVAYAREQAQALIPVTGDAGLTAREAIERSGVTRQFPEIDLAVNKVGIYGKLVSLDQVLEPGDRVEIYRPLIADPKEQRKKRAAEGKVMRKGAGEISGEAAGGD
jgi:putative ubiquitin-RnfH superfamily antitoxin RatB of RatAB toxin-antitoxin module